MKDGCRRGLWWMMRWRNESGRVRAQAGLTCSRMPGCSSSRAENWHGANHIFDANCLKVCNGKLTPQLSVSISKDNGHSAASNPSSFRSGHAAMPA